MFVQEKKTSGPGGYFDYTFLYKKPVYKKPTTRIAKI